MATGLLAKVIKQLTDAGYPKSTAEKIASGDLPMDNASRMARATEQGFTLPTYHGTRSQDILEFDPTRSRGARAQTGVWSDQNPIMANTYAGSIDDGNILPLLVRPDNFAQVDVAGQNWSRISPDTIIRHSDGTESRAGDLIEVLFQDYTNTNDIARLARSRGDEGVRFYNIQDPGPYSGWRTTPMDKTPAQSDNLTVFNPANIRSRFAAFDPDQLGSPNLLASVGGGLGVGLLGLTEEAQADQPELFWDKIVEQIGVNPTGLMEQFGGFKEASMVARQAEKEAQRRQINKLPITGEMSAPVNPAAWDLGMLAGRAGLLGTEGAYMNVARGERPGFFDALISSLELADPVGWGLLGREASR